MTPNAAAGLLLEPGGRPGTPNPFTPGVTMDQTDPTAAIEVWARMLCAADVHVYGGDHPTWQQLVGESGQRIRDDYRSAARWLLPRMTVAPKPAAVVSPPTDRADLRDRIAEALARVDGHGQHSVLGSVIERYRHRADAVLAVLPAVADRAATLAEAIRRVEDPKERAKTTTGLGLGWEAARDVLRRMAVEAHGTGTPQPETPPAEVEWLVQTRWHDGDWRDWSRRAERTEAEAEYERARDGKHAWRLVRVTTSYAIEAAAEPAPVAQQPAAEAHLTPSGNVRVDHLLRVHSEQQAAAADGEEANGSAPLVATSPADRATMPCNCGAVGKQEHDWDCDANLLPYRGEHGYPEGEAPEERRLADETAATETIEERS